MTNSPAVAGVNKRSRRAAKSRNQTEPAAPFVFISYKSVDVELAEKFKDALIQLGLRDSEIYVSAEIAAGTPFRADILNALKKSTILILLYTDPSYDWDWCLFECGYFAGATASSVDMSSGKVLACVRAGSAKPAALDHWQDISSSATLTTFLKSIGEKSGSDLVRRTTFPALVDGLWNSFMQRGGQRENRDPFRQRKLTVLIPKNAIASGIGQEIPSESRFECTDGAIEDIFPKLRKYGSIIVRDDFQNGIDDIQIKWLAAIPIMIRMLESYSKASPMLPLIRSPVCVEGEIVAYRPSVVQREDFFQQDAQDERQLFVRYHLVFIRTPDSSIAGADTADKLFHWYMLSRNFRSSVLVPCLNRLKGARATAMDIVGVIDQLDDEITLATIDAESRGLSIDGEDDFASISREAIRRLNTSWLEIIDDIHAQRKKFSLLKAEAEIEDVELSVLQENFKRLLSINTQFCIQVAVNLIGDAVVSGAGRS